MRRRVDLYDDTGSTVPLILGFFLIALLVVAGAVLASDAFTKQRQLQSICDGAALAAANRVNSRIARTEPLAAGLPLGDVQQAADDYVGRDAGRAGVQVAASLAADGQTMLLDCRRHVQLAFQSVIGRSAGVDEHATARARSVIG
jgi:uncharacterized membrane protein